MLRPAVLTLQTAFYSQSLRIKTTLQTVTRGATAASTESAAASCATRASMIDKGLGGGPTEMPLSVGRGVRFLCKLTAPHLPNRLFALRIKLSGA
jgi:hypothetical protein